MKAKKFDVVQNPDGSVDLVPIGKFSSREEVIAAAKWFIDSMTEDKGKKPS